MVPAGCIEFVHGTVQLTSHVELQLSRPILADLNPTVFPPAARLHLLEVNYVIARRTVAMFVEIETIAAESFCVQ